MAAHRARDVLLGAILCFGFGLFFTGVGTGVIPWDARSIHAPLWVIALCGMAMILFGIALLQLVFKAAWLHRIQPGLLIVLCFAVVMSWIAFGPGERHFRSSLGVPFWTGDASSSELFGRALFGMVAVFLDLLALAMMWRAARKHLRTFGVLRARLRD